MARAWRHFLHPLAAILAAVLAAPVGLIVLAGLVLQFQPARDVALRAALHRIRAPLPGDLVIDRVRWSDLDAITLTGVLWTIEGDTLLAAEHFKAELDLPPLLRRDLALDELEAKASVIDLAAIRLALARDRGGKPGAAPGGRPPAPSFPRDGFLGLPSVRWGRLDVAIARLTLPDSTLLVDLEAAGSGNLLRGGPGRLALERLRGRAPAKGWQISGTTLAADLGAGTVEGESRGQLGDGWPYHLQILTVAEDSLLVELYRGEGPGPPEDIGLNLWAGLNRERLRLRGADLDLELRTPDLTQLRRWPGLDSLAVDLGDLEGVTARFRGNVGLEGETAAGGTLVVEPNAWLPGGALLAGSWRREAGLRADSLLVGLEGLAYRGGAALDDSVLSARGRAELRSWDWLRRLRPDAEPPDSLVADLLLDARWPLTAEGTGVAAFGLVMHELSLSGSLGLTRDRQALTVHLSPLELGRAEEVRLPPLQGAPRTAHVIRDAATGELEVHGVRLIGGAGDLTVEGIWVPNDRADFDLAGIWPVPPELLLSRLPLTPAQRAEIESRWPLEGPYEVRATARADLVEGTRLSASGTLRLPGPGTLGPLLAGQTRFDEWGPIQGRFEVSGASGQEGFRYEGTLDLDRSDWLAQAFLRFRGAPGMLAADTLALALPGIRIAGRTSRTDGVWDARGTVRVTDAELARRFLPQLDPSAAVDLSARGRFLGTPQDPDLTADVTGSLVLPRVTLPELAGTVRWTADGLRARLVAPSGLAAGGLAFDRADVSYRSRPGRSAQLLPADLRVDLAGSDLSFASAAQLERVEPSGWHARFDSTWVRVGEQEMRAVETFMVTLLPEAKRVEVEDLRLAGGLGTISVDGVLAPQGATLAADAQLVLPPEPILVRIDRRLWPQRLSISLRARDPDSLRLEIEAAGLDIGHHARMPAALAVSGGGGALEANLRVGEAQEVILSGQAKAAGDFRLYPFRFRLGEGSLAADLELADFPLPVSVRGIGGSEPIHHPAFAAGRILLRGPPASPAAFCDLLVTFREWPKMQDYVLHLQARLAGGGGIGPDVARQGLQTTLLDQGRWTSQAEQGLAAALVLSRGQEPVLEGSAAYPLEWSLSPFAFRAAEGGELHLALDSQPLELAHFDPLLPPHVTLNGTAEVHLGADGPVADPALTGRLDANDLRLSLATGTRVTGDVALELAGSRRAPVVGGSIEIEQGLIRVPEEERELLPTEGEPVLWQQGMMPRDAEEAVAASEPGRGLPGLELNVTVRIPSALWLRGRGLEVELAGDLELVQKGGAGRPTVAGNLRSVQGTFQLLGRSFDVRTGEVIFYGEDELDPSLDLLLTTRVSDAVIEIAFTGTLQDPEMTLSSTPEMDEGDIMSYLVFGEPVDRLSGDQLSLVQNRAAEMVTAFGATELAGALSQQLGVDLLTVRQGVGNEETTLIVGKYLSPDILLKYEQPLDQRQTFFVNLEYFITSQLKLETLVGQGQEAHSGLEMQWSSEY